MGGDREGKSEKGGAVEEETGAELEMEKWASVVGGEGVAEEGLQEVERERYWLERRKA